MYTTAQAREMAGLGVQSWQEYADSRTLTDKEKLIQETLRVVLLNDEVRISEFKNNKISFYITFKNDPELHVKEVTIEKFIENHCKLWADIRWVMPFIKWDQSLETVCKRINLISGYATMGRFLTDELDEYGKDNISEIWNVNDYFDAIKYLTAKQREQKQKEYDYERSSKKTKTYI